MRVPVEHGLPKQGPTFLRKLLWGSLVVWLLCLAFLLLDPLPFFFPGDDSSAGDWWQTDVTTPIAAPADEAPTPDHPELVALRQQLAAAIVNGDLGSAIAVVRAQRQAPAIYPYQDDLVELGETLAALKRTNTTVADILREHMNEEVVIRVKKRPVRIIPRASAGERLNALVVPGNSNQPRRSATFNIADLSPLERSRWVGEADTPLKCLMKLYLHLEADDRDGARAFAPGCGDLATALEEQLESPTP
jgi:hypothetical protein